MALAQGNNTPTPPRIEPGSPDPESDALTTRPVRSPNLSCVFGLWMRAVVLYCKNLICGPTQGSGKAILSYPFMHLYVLYLCIV